MDFVVQVWVCGGGRDLRFCDLESNEESECDPHNYALKIMMMMNLKLPT